MHTYARTQEGTHEGWPSVLFLRCRSFYHRSLTVLSHDYFERTQFPSTSGQSQGGRKQEQNKEEPTTQAGINGCEDDGGRGTRGGCGGGCGGVYFLTAHITSSPEEDGGSANCGEQYVGAEQREAVEVRSAHDIGQTRVRPSQGWE